MTYPQEYDKMIEELKGLSEEELRNVWLKTANIMPSDEQKPYLDYEYISMKEWALIVKGEIQIRNRAKDITQRLEEQGFYEVMQSYRCANIADQKRVIQCFEDVKEFVRNMIREIVEETT